MTTKYRDAWGANANVTKYAPDDVVMVTVIEREKILVMNY
jgi:hypothetical protein